MWLCLLSVAHVLALNSIIFLTLHHHLRPEKPSFPAHRVLVFRACNLRTSNFLAMCFLQQTSSISWISSAQLHFSPIFNNLQQLWCWKQTGCSKDSNCLVWALGSQIHCWLVTISENPLEEEQPFIQKDQTNLVLPLQLPHAPKVHESQACHIQSCCPKCHTLVRYKNTNYQSKSPNKW